MRAMSLSFGAFGAAAVLLAACRPGGREAAVTPTPPPPASVAPARAPPAPALAGEFDAVGTEPFWSVQARPGRLLYQRMGEGALSRASAGPQPRADGAVVWDANDMNLEVRPGACSDGMSDRVFPYAATVTLSSGEVLKGCAAPPGYFDGEPRP